MSKHVLFIHGARVEGWEADKKLADSLQVALGVVYLRYQQAEATRGG